MRFAFFQTTIVLLLAAFPLKAQFVTSVKAGYLGFHPGSNPNSALYENAISESGQVVVEPSVWIGLEMMIREDHTSVQVYQGFMADAAARSAMFTYIGFKRKFLQRNRSSFVAEIGTTYSRRENWSALAGYKQENSYSGTGKWQDKWIYVSGGLSYYFYINKRNDITFTVWYGHYDNTITFMLGHRFWFSTILKHPKPCKCPFDKYDKKYKRNK
jgi:hypothetical protein